MFSLSGYEQSHLIRNNMGCLELQAEPRKMSIYREEAVDVLIMCLKNSDYPDSQIAAAETLLVLQGRFSYSGKPLIREFLLKRAGLDQTDSNVVQNYTGYLSSSQESMVSFIPIKDAVPFLNHDTRCEILNFNPLLFCKNLYRKKSRLLRTGRGKWHFLLSAMNSDYYLRL